MNLSAPRLFQLDRSTGILDLQLLNPPNPGVQGDEGDPVVVSVLLPDAAQGNLTVWFGDTNKIFPIVDPRWIVMECLFSRSELPPLGGTYSVYWEYGGQFSPRVGVTLIDSMASFMPRHNACILGVYPPRSAQSPSLIDVWAVPGYRSLLKSDPVVKPIEGNPPADVDLKVMWAPFGGEINEIGEISYSVASDRWNVDLHRDCVSLQRSDLILIQSGGAGNQMLNFVILL